MSEEEIDFLEGLQNNTIEVQAGTDFIVEGDNRKTTFIVIDGWSIRYTSLADGRRQILSYALPGDILGLHINFNAQATYSAAAMNGLSWCTAREFAILGDHAVRLGRLPAKARLAHLLLELWHRLELIGDNDGKWLEMPMTQMDLADTLGLSLVHTNRSLSALRRSGLVSVSKNYIKLEDINALVRLAEFNPEHLAEFSI